jgi:DNA adenine methylase
VTKLGPILEDIHSRLAGVVIECLPWREFIDRYDSPADAVLSRSALLGLGGRLWRRRLHPCRFRRSRHAPSADLRPDILSVNDVPETREFFRRFAIETVATCYTVSGGKWSDVTEIVVTGPSAAPLPASRGRLDAPCY